MPRQMLMRSAWEETSLSAPDAVGDIDRWVAATGSKREEPIPLDLFLRYSAWFAEQFVRERDPNDVVAVEDADGRFRVTTAAGDEVEAAKVVLAVGVMPFAYVPPPLVGFVGGAVSLASGRPDELAALGGQRVLVVGGGQAGLESAGLAAQGGATVELVTRSEVRWFGDREPYYPRTPFRQRLYRLAYPAVGYGPPPLNRLVLHPDFFAALPCGSGDPSRRTCCAPAARRGSARSSTGRSASRNTRRSPTCARRAVRCRSGSQRIGSPGRPRPDRMRLSLRPRPPRVPLPGDPRADPRHRRLACDRPVFPLERQQRVLRRLRGRGPVRSDLAIRARHRVHVDASRPHPRLRARAAGRDRTLKCARPCPIARPMFPACSSTQLDPALFTSDRLDELCREAAARGTLKVQFADPGRQRYGNDPHLHARRATRSSRTRCSVRSSTGSPTSTSSAAASTRSASSTSSRSPARIRRSGGSRPRPSCACSRRARSSRCTAIPTLKLVSTIAGETDLVGATAGRHDRRRARATCCAATSSSSGAMGTDQELRIPPGHGCFVPSRWAHWLDASRPTCRSSASRSASGRRDEPARSQGLRRQLAAAAGGVDPEPPGASAIATKRRVFDGDQHGHAQGHQVPGSLSVAGAVARLPAPTRSSSTSTRAPGCASPGRSARRGLRVAVAARDGAASGLQDALRRRADTSCPTRRPTSSGFADALVDALAAHPADAIARRDRLERRGAAPQPRARSAGSRRRRSARLRRSRSRSSKERTLELARTRSGSRSRGRSVVLDRPSSRPQSPRSGCPACSSRSRRGAPIGGGGERRGADLSSPMPTRRRARSRTTLVRPRRARARAGARRAARARRSSCSATRARRSCCVAMIVDRTWPPLGGSSVMRRTIAPPEDALAFGGAARRRDRSRRLLGGRVPPRRGTGGRC